ncbi:PHF7 protein, partial [Alectura lathami]|nr:PHF7 protein [Alectura lathami]
NAGILNFQCPACREIVQFSSEMMRLGIQIPIRGATWLNPDINASLLQRHRRCNASECLSPGGRQYAERQGPWQLLLCRSCAAEGTHRRCSALSSDTNTWECEGCAGVGTGKRQTATCRWLGARQGLA